MSGQNNSQVIKGGLVVDGDLIVTGNINKGLNQAQSNQGQALGVIQGVLQPVSSQGSANPNSPSNGDLRMYGQNTVINSGMTPAGAAGGNTNGYFEIDEYINGSWQQLFEIQPSTTGNPNVLDLFISGRLFARDSVLSAPGRFFYKATSTPFGSANIYSIAFGNGVFVAVSFSGTIARSTDNGVTWGSLITNPFGGAYIYSIAFGNGVFVACGTGGTIARSTDNGVTWGSLITNPFGSAGIVSIAFGNGVFVACGTGGTIAWSTDNGVTWGSLITNPFGSASIHSIAFGNGVFVAGGTGGTIARSTDNGVTWGSLITNPFGSDYISSIAFGNGVFVACTNGGQVARSLDLGLTWGVQYGSNSTITVLSTNIFTIAKNGLGRFVIGGYDSSNIPISYTDYVEAGAGIVNSGSNSNGSFVQFADGTMIMRGMIITPTASAGVVFTPPAAFINNSQFGDTDLSISSDAVPTVTSIEYSQVWANYSSLAYYTTVSERLMWLFIGRWK